MTIKKRAFAAFMGMAAADAMSWPALFHRSYLLPFWTRRIRREIDARSEDMQLTRLPLPFSLNQPASVYAIGPTDDTEWAAFTAIQLLNSDGNPTPQKWYEAWLQLANLQPPVRGSISILSALENLRRGKLPPASGHDNPHYFDDSALCRAVPIGIVWAGQPARAAEFAAMDAAITNSHEGVLAAQVIAVMMSRICVGEKIDPLIVKILELLPEKSWLGLTVRRALTISEAATSIFDIFPRLSDQIINREYSYGDAAPETLALVLAILKVTGGDFESAIFAATAFAKTADSVPALVGAMSGARRETAFDYSHWRASLQSLKGICIPTLQGENFIKIAEDLAQLAAGKGKQTQ
ncbi:ADP-ribosylglycohydrolase family protein [candidate division KSB1 bacterium]|nr:ADP-ribosylglycohydrolase family protein [candidate division KSB1 bacterium]